MTLERTKAGEEEKGCWSGGGEVGRTPFKYTGPTLGRG